MTGQLTLFGDELPERPSSARGGLAAYAAHPLFRTVSLDRTFYAPLSQEAFAAYAASVPEDFRFVVKAPAAITDPAVRKPGSGEISADNPGFLDARLAVESFVGPATAGLGRKAGPLVFQFPPLGRRERAARRTLEPPRRPRLRGGAGRLLSVRPAHRGGSADAGFARRAHPHRRCRGPRGVRHDQQQSRGIGAAVGAEARGGGGRGDLQTLTARVGEAGVARPVTVAPPVTQPDSQAAGPA